MLKKIISLASTACIFLLSLSGTLTAQNSYSGWNIYTSLREVKGVGVGQNTVWAASTGGLFKFDQNNLSGIKKYTTLDGLLSNELTSIVVSTDGKVWAGSFDGS